jgi:hypothetical protein
VQVAFKARQGIDNEHTVAFAFGRSQLDFGSDWPIRRIYCDWFQGKNFEVLGQFAFSIILVYCFNRNQLLTNKSK